MVALETCKLFGGLSAAELQMVRQTAKVREFSQGHQIIKEGEQGDGIYIVTQGQVQISALVGQEERRVLTRIGPGDFFGEMAVLDNEPRSATVTAEQPTTTYFILRSDLVRMLESSPKLAVSLVREFSLRMRDFNRQYIQEVLQAERLTLVGRFARSIVHDFKNPLNVIGISAEIAGLDSTAPALRKSAATRIRKQVDRLSNMINELLEFTRGSQNPIVLAQTNYRTFVQQLIEEIRQEAAEKSVTVEFENEPPSLEVLMDPHRLAHVFYNLIHNAVDAMPGGGKVILRFYLKNNEIITQIEDTGKGLAPEIVPRLFEAFATFGKAQGTGLGLSICKKIIKDHRGWIGALTEKERGGIFLFSLPIAH